MSNVTARLSASAAGPECVNPGILKARRLIIDAIPEDFDPARHVALGPWCFVGREQIYPAWENIEFPRAFTDNDELARASAAAQRIAEHRAAILGERLGQRHGVRRDRRFWRMVLMPWLLALAQGLLARWRYIEAFVEMQSGTPLTLTLRTAEIAWRFRDQRDFYRRALAGTTFNLWLDSLLLTRLAPTTWPREEQVQAAAPLEDVGNEETGNRRGLRGIWRRWHSAARFSRVKGVRGAALPMSLLVSLLPSRRDTAIEDPPLGQLDEDGLPAGFGEFYDTMIAVTEPLAYGDTKTFLQFDRAAAAHRFRAGKLRVVGPILAFDEADTFFLAHAARNGERIVATQHGGGYGAPRINTNMSAIEYRQDAFLSWGWQAHESYSGRFVALPSPFLSRVAGRHRERDRSLVLVGNTARVRAFRLDCAAEPAYAVAYRKERQRFIEDLPPQVRAQLVYRPYFFEELTALADEPHFLKLFPDLKICRSGFEKALLGCRLMVVDHPETTLLVALAADTPLLGFWDPAARAPSRQAAPYFEALTRAGVFHTTPQSAARKAAQVWDDVAGWWHTPEVRRAVVSFRDAYARASHVWWWHWAMALGRLAAGQRSA